jgi:hypothetical protein
MALNLRRLEHGPPESKADSLERATDCGRDGRGKWLAGSEAWEPHAFAYPPVIRLAEVGPFRAAPEFLLRRQVSDDIAAGPRGGVIARV